MTITPQQLCQRLAIGFRKQGGGGGGGGGGRGGGGGGGSGGGGAGAGAGATQPQQPVPIAQDVWAMGFPPSIYNKDRTKANNWLEELKMYLRVNRDVAGFDSPIKKVAVALSFIKGPQVAEWVGDYGRVLDTLDPTNDNIPAVWD